MNCIDCVIKYTITFIILSLVIALVECAAYTVQRGRASVAGRADARAAMD